MRVLIIGANGFIGNRLTETILAKTDWHVSAIDLFQDKLQKYLSHERLYFHLGDISKEKNWVIEQIKCCDVVLPLAAIATPATYVNNPLQIFELDFEANLEIVRQCDRFSKRLIFPSTSEVYGMCPDAEFDEEQSHLVTGPIHKERWIYASSKQLLDRVIYAYGKHHHLSYTLFRPFNWYGPRLDSIDNPKPGGSRVITQFIGHILRGEDISLVNGGAQQRCFTYLDDGIAALLKIIENKNACAHQKIFNIGNPNENVSIRTLAETLMQLIKAYPGYAHPKTQLVDVSAESYYGTGYQDVSLRVPSIKRAQRDLDWQPETTLITGLKKTLAFWLESDYPVQVTCSSTTEI